jgi:hypothetical protein
VWERQGKSALSGKKYLAGKEYVVWASMDGVAEVINRSDGSTLWKAAGVMEPQAFLNPDGTRLIVQWKKEFTIVNLGS